MRQMLYVNSCRSLTYAICKQSSCTVTLHIGTYASESWPTYCESNTRFYTPLQSSTDLPLLNHISNTATHLLYSLNPPPVPASPSPGPRTNAEEAIANRVPLAPSDINPPFHIGFITPPFKDNKIPITDHLHCHAYIGSPDLAGWWRGVAYSGVAWYPIQDLIAEIR